MIKQAIAAGLILFICACGTSKKTTTSTTTNTNKETTTTTTTMPMPLNVSSEGKALYDAHCGSCHELKDPKSETADDWKNIVPRMVKMTNRKAGSEVIDAKKQEAILQYVLAGAKTN